MIGCMMIDCSTSERDAIVNILQKGSYGEGLELNMGEGKVVFIYIHNCNKWSIWQLTLELEVLKTKVSYGFGENKADAKAEAIDRLRVINLELEAGK